MKRYECAKTTRKTSLKRIIKTTLTFCLCVGGALIILGTAGSSDLGMDISMMEIIIKDLFGFVLILCGMLVDAA